ncbi:hypothetical protein FOIG_03238 [Fusarium odoratissimum NRRL 54006]|uniref:Uncharacterized protein n=1 Tax=Fusarium odoratissimum (strain NRRL 54006) TaxID=1089451 RepID=X0KCR8_FUSO5|nr:uncharacterized protein FOIG_03238 [Fusarium odoratissimum NRRL 54006]EXM06446.1 hypothetical protein FOIG_03238 [Fusarium odoratissimum NRRL 54006]
MGRTRILCGSLFSGRRNIRSGQSGCRACMRRTRLSRLPSTSELYGRCMRSRRIKWRIQTERGQSQNQKVHHELLASILGGRVCMERRGEEEALCETSKWIYLPRNAQDQERPLLINSNIEVLEK